MRWKPSGRSRNIEDRRGQRAGYGRRLPGRLPTSLGCGGLILILVISYVMGWNPLPLLMTAGGGGETAQVPVGDDRIQKMSGRYVNPDAFTHGSSRQRMEWFTRGLETGDLDACDTFGAAGL